ncbi:MAG: glycosyltransferase, partial [Ardenticatenales bacterium]|nr:glycosyltransferase [Ardenticatenales bacterium]
MRVVQLIDLLYWGGAQKLLVTFTAAARARGVTPIIISLRHDSDTPVIAAELRSLGAEVLVFAGSGLMDPLRIWKLARFLRHEKVDILHTHLTYANIIGAIAGRLAGVAVVSTIHNTQDDQPYYHPVRAQMEAWLLRHSVQRVIAVGHIVAEANKARLGKKAMDIIPNAVDLPTPIPAEERQALRTELIGDPMRPLILSVGRLSPQKAHSDLLIAFADLRESNSNATLVIAGDGPLRAELEAQIKTLGLEGHAWLLGMRNDVPRLLAASDIFATSSHWEGLPIAVLEALAAGLPVVGTTVGDVPKVVVEGTGLLVPPREPGALAAALRSL